MCQRLVNRRKISNPLVLGELNNYPVGADAEVAQQVERLPFSESLDIEAVQTGVDEPFPWQL